MREIEVKLKTDDFEGVRQRLQALGARFKENVEEETDLMFRPARDPEAMQGEVLRLRLVGTTGLLTWKGKPEFQRGVKMREELQTRVEDAGVMRELLSRLGYEVNLEFSKCREYWDLRGMAVSLDELSFGRYVEIEGEETEIERTVIDLRLVDAERIQEGYPQLAARHLGR